MKSGRYFIHGFRHGVRFEIAIAARRLRLYLRRRRRELVCSVFGHPGTYTDIDWGHSYVRCKRCHVILEDLQLWEKGAPHV